MLKSLANLKKHILMLERLRYGMEFCDKQYEKFCLSHDEPKSISELEYQIADYDTSYISAFIPKEVMELWLSCDMEVYTSEFHNRKYFNEIENDEATCYFLLQFLQLIGVETCESDSAKYMVYIYDFNDFPVFFETEEDMDSFLDGYKVAPCVCFERNDDMSWEEIQSI